MVNKNTGTAGRYSKAMTRELTGNAGGSAADKLVRDRLLAVIRSNKYVNNDKSLNDTIATLAGYGTELLGILDRKVRGPGEPDQYAASVAHLISFGVSETVLDNCVFFAPLLEAEELWTVAPLVRSLEQYRELDGRACTYRTAGTGESLPVLCLMRTVLAIEDHCGHDLDDYIVYSDDQSLGVIPVIRDSRLVTLVLGNPESNALINDMIKGRGTADYEMLRDVVRCESAALVSGTL